MNFLISDFEENTVHIEVIDFLIKLQSQWTQVKMEYVSGQNNGFRVRWELEINGNSLLGGVHQNLQGVSIEGQFEAIANFAVWFRHLIPFNQKLFLYDEGFNNHAELFENTTTSELLIYLQS